MTQMAPTRPYRFPVLPLPVARHAFRMPLLADLTASASARAVIENVIRAWRVPVDADVAVLLTSELVTNAIRHEQGDTITVVITCAYGQLHVDVHDTSCTLPVPMDGPPDAETGRGLVLVASLSSSWGYYRTTTGKAVYFTLAFQDGLAEEAGSSGE